MKALVTGAAGFIGSTLAERLVDSGWDVVGVDCFSDYYAPDAKRSNLSALASEPRFTLVEGDLLSLDSAGLVRDADVVFHLAGQPGVRLSWADGFERYNSWNVNVTQRLLEAAKAHEVDRFVFASSSSVYGQVSTVPTTEDHPTNPHSPYGVTKLAAELLCRAYGANFGVPTVSLRYFTVFGPRQRPDMAIHRMIEAALSGTDFPLFGDGSQVRDFTYVDDIVSATALAGSEDVPPGSVMNVAGGSSIRVSELIDMVGAAAGSPVPIDQGPAQPGDVTRTGGSTERAFEMLGWSPTVDVREGVRRQVEWHRARRS